MTKRTIDELHMLQGLPLSVKVEKTKQRIREWVEYYGEDGVYVSFSGGKDSTVLLHIVRELYPNVPAVFCDTGLEYPEIREFVKGFENVVWLKPKMTFRNVIEKYGYPMISKEVAECVSGARRYLRELEHQISISQTDRQTDRQTDSCHTLTDLISCADLASLANPSRGGADSRYRKLKGTGEFSKSNRQRKGTKADRDTSEEGQSDPGDYP